MEILFQEQKLRVLSDNFSECNDKTFLQHLAKVDTFGIYKLIFHTFWQQAVAVLVARSENLCFPLLIWWHKVRGSQSVSHFYQRSGLSSGEKTCLLLSADTVSSTSNGALEKLWNRNIVLDVLPLLVFSTKTIAEVAELLCVCDFIGSEADTEKWTKPFKVRANSLVSATSTGKVLRQVGYVGVTTANTVVNFWTPILRAAINILKQNNFLRLYKTVLFTLIFFTCS